MVSNGKPGPLEGIRVVEYGVFHAGPGAGAILGDMGADVIKVEAPGGDPERFWTTVGGLDMSDENGQSFMHEVSNRNKKGICLNIKTDRGREVLNKLLEGADVFLTNLRKSTKAKLELDYEAVSKLNPNIIHANVSGYGPEGPMADLGAFDPLGLAMSGMMFATGGDEPKLLHLGILDQAAAIATSHAIISALFVRARQGKGQEVHVSLFSTAIWLMHCNYLLNEKGVNPADAGDRSRHSPLRNSFCCKDGKWILGTHHPEERYWPAFLEATGQEGLLDDPRFAEVENRKKNNAELTAVFDKVFATKTRDEWMALFLPRRLMFCPIQTVADALGNAQALANDYVIPFEHPNWGPMHVPGFPIHFSENHAGIKTKAPGLGEHTDTVLAELGYSKDGIEKLKKSGVIE